MKLPAAADSCKTFVVGAGGKFPGREKIGISQQSTRPGGRNFLGPDFRETPGFIRQKENSYRKAYRPGEIYLGRTRVGEALAGELRGLHART